MSKAKQRAKERYWLEPSNIDTQNKYQAYLEGYHQAEKDILSEYGWLISNVRNLKLKYCHNREAVEAVEDVCGKLYKFKTDIEHG